MKTWLPGWREALAAALSERGSESLWAYAMERPDWTLFRLADELGRNAAQMERILIEEGLPIDPRHVARDLLARGLLRHLPKGWGVGPKADWKAIMAYAPWATAMQRRCGWTADECLALFRRLKALAPEGWIPTGSEDPILRAAFGEADA